MSGDDTNVYSGRFGAENGRTVIGQIHLLGENTYVILSDSQTFRAISRDDGCITGTLLDFTKVTLIDCIPLEGPIRGERNGEPTCSWRVFPHHCVLGDRHVLPLAKSVQTITLFLADATAFFYDFFAFGSMLDAKKHVADLVRSNFPDDDVEIGAEPQIAYFTGKREISRVDTVLGTIVAEHNPMASWGGPHGVSIHNRISISLTPPSAVTFSDAMDRTSVLLRFFELAIGRPQVVDSLVIHTSDGGELPSRLRVFSSFDRARKDNLESDRFRPHPGDVLLDPIRHHSEFSAVVAKWLAMDETYANARVRFSDGFGNGNRYSIERLVGAANMFDLLPATAVPQQVPLSEDVAHAAKTCTEIFERLRPKDSPERQSILSALGRLGRSSLRQKVAHRASIVLAARSKPIDELMLVVREAVKCRNYFVHGSHEAGEIHYGENSEHLSFLTDTLEFVFSASELVESGWDINRWWGQGTTMSHPFGRYRVEYSRCLASLKKDLGAAKLTRTRSTS